MTGFIVGRLVAAIPVIFVIALTVFVLGHLLPGDPITFIIGQSHSTFAPEQIAAIRHDYGLDQPIYVQFVIWLGKALTGDFGRSFQSHQPVLDVIIPLAACIWLRAHLSGVIVGIAVAYRGGWVDNVVMRVLDGLMGAAIADPGPDDCRGAWTKPLECDPRHRRYVLPALRAHRAGSGAGGARVRLHPGSSICWRA
jgi:ABC-type dipeptide/oligopeptide/nickel transport system permease component